jgi:hypothetical protein
MVHPHSLLVVPSLLLLTFTIVYAGGVNGESAILLSKEELLRLVHDGDIVVFTVSFVF